MALGPVGQAGTGGRDLTRSVSVPSDVYPDNVDAPGFVSPHRKERSATGRGTGDTQ